MLKSALDSSKVKAVIEEASFKRYSYFFTFEKWCVLVSEVKVNFVRQPFKLNWDIFHTL